MIIVKNTIRFPKKGDYIRVLEWDKYYEVSESTPEYVRFSACPTREYKNLMYGNHWIFRDEEDDTR